LKEEEEGQPHMGNGNAMANKVLVVIEKQKAELGAYQR